jgi:hypothetical protein
VNEGERETRVIALDHAWRWYENRRSQAMTLLQMLFGWLAICGAAYGVSIQAMSSDWAEWCAWQQPQG